MKRQLCCSFLVDRFNRKGSIYSGTPKLYKNNLMQTLTGMAEIGVKRMP
jgi:hypothetical protein